MCRVRTSLVVAPTRGEQRGVRAAFDDPARLEHDDQGGTADDGQAVQQLSVAA